ncbi:hypothetical protein HN385_04140 [archaeon]|jgi:thymidine kinase|nr:hypothetical protein [archaeon]MBT3451401.1 hypothetical protein [archaeon]MBT6869010.1 hypothetical protein [archaeon]MBT7193276.1 hypothetical protein [archaeon]MBT7380131.1 hypothetical protein [archaeon]
MDLREIAVNDLLGRIIAFLSVMNGGKTRSLVGELERVRHSSLNFSAYNPKKNNRDGSYLSVNGEPKILAKPVESILEIKEDIIKIREILSSNQVKYSGNNGIIEIDGIKYRKNWPLAAVGIDEINLFCLTEKDTKDVADFFKWSKQNGLVSYLAGLEEDFRHRNFGNFHLIKNMVNHSLYKKPVCKAINSGTQCSKPAMHTQRLWSLEFAKDLGLESMLGDLELFPYVDKNGDINSKNYLAAPYFDQTVRIEAEKTKQIVYLPVCEDCARLPYKKEVFDVFEAIKENQDPAKVLNNDLLTKFILEYLSNDIDGFVKQERGLYVPKRYVHNSLGGFSTIE